jgi:hypothetical protein
VPDGAVMRDTSTERVPANVTFRGSWLLLIVLHLKRAYIWESS